MRSARSRLAVTVVASAAALLAGPLPAANAAYPGRDGTIAFGMADATGAHIYAVEPNGHRLHQLTDGPYEDLCAAYSPAGRAIAFCSNRSGSFEIWSMTSYGRRLRLLTSLAYATFPDYSPDGTRIAFDGHAADDPNDQIFVMRRDGSGLHQITSGAGNNDFPAWSPDGRKIAFISDRTGVEQVWTMRADGSAATQLTDRPVDHGQLPDWSPDGRQIAYTQVVAGDGKIFVMSADGSDQHQVSTGAGDDFGPAWSPDGRRIAFVRDFRNGDRPVEVMNSDGRHTHPLADPGGASTQFVPAWQPLPDGPDGR